jgi:5-methylcytosine-specific restriction endonuclease McrA
VGETKYCGECGVDKPVAAFNKRTLKSGTVTLQTKCRDCQKAYVAANREHLKANCRAYWAKNKAAQNQNQREYYQNNKKAADARSKAWADANPERVTANWRAAYHRRGERELENQRAKYQRIKEKLKPTRKAWAKANPDKIRTYEQNRRAVEMGAEGSFTPQEWQDRLIEFNYHCAYCLQKIEGAPHREHMMPLSRGGSNFIENIVPSCATCNRKKHDKTLLEFAREATAFDFGRPSVAA